MNSNLSKEQLVQIQAWDHAKQIWQGALALYQANPEQGLNDCVNASGIEWLKLILRCHKNAIEAHFIEEATN